MQEPKKPHKSEIQQHLSVEENHSLRRDDRGMLTVEEDKEYFLRKTFLRDEWEGCTLVFEYYYKPLCSHAIRFVHSKTYAEDIVSDVFLTFWKKNISGRSIPHTGSICFRQSVTAP